MSKLFVGNWKMVLSDDAAVALAEAYVPAAKDAACETAVAPSFTALERVSKAIEGSKVALAAQDVFWASAGAYTGEISAPMLAALGVKYVIVGHSERRALGETDEMVAKKAAAVSQAGLVPIVCVGETAEEKAAGRREEVVRAQVAAVLSGFPVDATNVVIAYEPRWAIGTGLACAPDEAALVHELIKSIVPVRVLYGGSVDASNIASYLALPSVDGTLVGGASTKADQAAQLLKAF